MSDAEILELIIRLRRGEGSEEEVSEWLECLVRAIPCPRISDLIFYGNNTDTADEILRKARSYKPIRI